MTNPIHTLLWWAGVAVLAVAGLAYASTQEWPAAPAVQIVNETVDSISVDVRWWGGAAGIDGPHLRNVRSGDSVVLRAPLVDEVCLRVVRHASGTVLSGLVELRDGDTVRVTVRPASDGSPNPTVEGPCPSQLGDHRVRVAHGRYFRPGEPDRLRRERLIRWW